MSLQKYLTFIPCVTGTLSVVGSSLILTSIGRRRKRRRCRANITADNSLDNANNVISRRNSSSSSINNSNQSSTGTYNRLMVGLCVFDLFFSIGLALGPLPSPSGAIRSPVWAMGNFNTCAVQGLFIYMGFATFAYNAMLMVYFVLVIRYNVSDQTLRRYCVEPVMHAVPVLYYTVTAILGYVWQIFNTNGMFCIVAAYPQGCEMDSYINNNYSNTCTRGGDHIHAFSEWIFMFAYAMWTLIIISASICVGVTVFQRYYESRRFDFLSSSPPGEQQLQIQPDNSISTSRRGEGGVSNNNSNSNNGEQKQEQRRFSQRWRQQQQQQQLGAATVRETIIQSSLYAGTFLNNMLWLSIQYFIYKFASDPKQYSSAAMGLGAVGMFFFPLQGFFNFFIYIRPRYLAIRRKHRRTMTRFFTLKEAIWYPVSTFEEREIRATAAENNNRIRNIFVSSSSSFLDSFRARATRSSNDFGPQMGPTNDTNAHDDNDGHPVSSQSLEQEQQEESTIDEV